MIFPRRADSIADRAMVLSMPEFTLKPREVFCSFCGKSQHETETMIAGPVLTAICTECVFQCFEYVAEKRVGTLGDRIDFAAEAAKLKRAVSEGHAYPAAGGGAGIDNGALPLIEGTLRFIAMLAVKYHNEQTRQTDG